MAKHKQEEHPEDVEVKEEAVETAEQAESASPEKSELELANERAEDFENKYLRAHAEMQNIQRRANEERQQLQRYRSQDLAKAILPSIDNLERALAVEGLTDDVKKGLEMVQESLIHALKEEGIEEIPADGAFDHNYHMAIQTVPADDEHPADTIAQVFQKGYKLHDRILLTEEDVDYDNPGLSCGFHDDDNAQNVFVAGRVGSGKCFRSVRVDNDLNDAFGSP